MQIVVRRCGNHRRTELFRAEMIAESTRKQAICKSDLRDIMLRQPRCDKLPRHQFRPVQNIVFRVAHDNRPAGRAGTGVNADDIPQRQREHVIGITCSQIVFRGERQTPQIVKRSNIFDFDALRVKRVFVKRDIAIDTVERRLQALDLQLRQIIPRHRFVCSIVHLIFTDF